MTSAEAAALRDLVLNSKADDVPAIDPLRLARAYVDIAARLAPCFRKPHAAAYGSEIRPRPRVSSAR